MLLTGQPLHAFDLDRVAGGAPDGAPRPRRRDGRDARRRRRARSTADMVVIADADGRPRSPGSWAARARRSARRRRACCSRRRTGTARTSSAARSRLGLRSEASARFEKGLSPGLPLEAQAVASALLVELCGARLLPGHDRRRRPGRAPPRRSTLRPSACARCSAPRSRRQRCARDPRLARLRGRRRRRALGVAVPHFRRGDVTREVDLIEEVARIDGLERLPATLPPRRGAARAPQPRPALRRRAEDALAARGLSEIAGWSFADPALLDRLRLPAERPDARGRRRSRTRCRRR